MRLFVIVLLFLSGCSSAEKMGRSFFPVDATRNHDRRTLSAKGDGWTLVVEWENMSLERHIGWTHSHTQTEGLFNLQLQNRTKAWTSSVKGVTSTAYGPYQPAFRVKLEDSTLDVTMTHERLDFPDMDNLMSFLAWDWYNDPKRVAFSPECILVALDVDRINDKHLALNIEIFDVRVKNASLNAPALIPFVKGSIELQKPKSQP